MTFNSNDLFRDYKPRMKPEYATTAHDYHVMEFEDMCRDMISKALTSHDEQLQVDVQTTLNGRPCSMPGLVADVKKQIMSALQKAFRK